ncbi:MAG: AraC family transcriptional regulator [Nitrospiraceae bacterium]
MNESGERRLERSCGLSASDWIRVAPSCPGIERLEASFSGHAFDPHRHDTYVIGFTLHGVQSFDYRGMAQHSVAGQAFVLHPDETHDGRAGTPAGFRYRALYVEPRLIQDAMGEPRCALPFVRDAVSNNTRLAMAIVPVLDDLDMPLEDLHRDQIVFNLTEALAAVDSSVTRRRLSANHWRAVSDARDFLDASVQKVVTSAQLEAITGLSRYELARQFRACLGTSPYRYLIMRRLDQVRALIQKGAPLADAAFSSGFADQSHMTRHFKRTYGMPPGRWVATTVYPARDGLKLPQKANPASQRANEKPLGKSATSRGAQGSLRA